MGKFFKRDIFGLGIIIGIVLPVIIFFLFYFINLLLGNPPITFDSYVQNDTFQLVCIVLNVLPFRQYMLKLKFDKTGKGLLISTFVYALGFVIYNFLLK